MIGSTLQDIRFAIRQLRKSPGFAFTSVMVFALGIGAATAIFAFVDAAFIKPLPYRDPSRLVALFERIPVGDRYHISYGDYLDWKRLNRSLSSLDVYQAARFDLKTRSGREEVQGVTVSDGFFRTLGVVPFLGRDFRPGEDLRSSQPTVIVSYETWKTRYAANPKILGQTITLDGTPTTIVGVLPADYQFAPVPAAAIWTPLRWDLTAGLRVGHPFFGVARLRPEVSRTTAYSDLASIARQIAIAYPNTNRDRTANVIPLAEVIYGDVRPTLMALLGGAGLLALIGFVNVSSLLLVRAESRRRETAIRGALGASRSRLVRQFAAEGFLLAVVGGAFGLAVTRCAIAILIRQVPQVSLESMPYLQGLRFNPHVFLFALGLSFFGGILFSAGPALQLMLSHLYEGLLEDGRTAAGRTWRRAGASLVVVELAITVVLLVSAGLLAKSFYRLLHEDVGISTDHLAVLHVVDEEASTNARFLATERRVRFAMAALPGVVSVGDSGELAVDTSDRYEFSFAHFHVIGRSYVGQGDEASERAVSVGYFETVRGRLLQGRYFSETDDASRPAVALINRTMAAQVFSGEDPLGKVIVNEYFTDQRLRIIGVVDDIKDGPLDTKPTAAVYNALNQDPTNSFYVTVRTSGSAQALLPVMVNTIHGLSSNLIANDQDTMESRISSSQAAYLHRCAAWLVAGFATLSLVLGTVGLYGVISYSVGQRTREIGVRMALGAQRSAVYQLILSEACGLAALGVVAGVCLSIPAARLLRSMLFGVSPRDTGTMIAVICILAAAAILASFLPARRAASIDPAGALRSE